MPTAFFGLAELGLYVARLHGQEDPAHFDKGQAVFGKLAQVGHGARRGNVKALAQRGVLCQLLRPAPQGFGARHRQQRQHLVEKVQPLFGAVKQRHAGAGQRHGKRQAGQAGPGADVDNACVRRAERQQRQAVEQVAAHHAGVVGDGGEIDVAVCLAQQHQIAAQRFALCVVKGKGLPRKALVKQPAQRRLLLRGVGREGKRGAHGPRLGGLCSVTHGFVSFPAAQAR